MFYKQKSIVIIILSVFLFGVKTAYSESYQVDEITCERTQTNVNKMAEIITDYPSEEAFDKGAAFGSILTPEFAQFNELSNNPNIPEKTKKLLFNLLLRQMGWAESVLYFHSAKDGGTSAANKEKYSEQINEYEQKENSLRQFCPKLSFPTFNYWNQLIQKNNK